MDDRNSEALAKSRNGLLMRGSSDFFKGQTNGGSGVRAKVGSGLRKGSERGFRLTFVFFGVV